jgi:hypothetical protein
MAQKGQFKHPVEPLPVAFDRVIDAIERSRARVAVFMVAGKILTTKSTSAAFERNLTRLANNLVGVYDRGADARGVREDLGTFYSGQR